MLAPENIHCLALNYKGVGESSEAPLYFVKSKSTLCHHGAIVPYPEDSTKMWSEVELGIVVRHDCENIAADKAADYIEGYIVCGDVTCENVFGRDHHLAFSKSRKNYCPVSTAIVTIDKERLDDLRLMTSINGTVTQEGRISEMVYDPYRSFSYVSHIVGLKKGDIILTGTPSGVENNVLHIGDRVRHTIEEIGSLDFTVGPNSHEDGGE